MTGVRVRIATELRNFPEALTALAAQADIEGIRVVRAVIDRWESGEERFSRPGEQLLVAVADDGVVAVGGLTICPTEPGALRVRRFYVHPAWRRRGVAAAITSTLLASWPPEVSVITCNAQATAAAPRFWEAMGFVPIENPGITHVLQRPPIERPENSEDVINEADVAVRKRQAARVVLLDDHGSILLIEIVRPEEPSFWLTPGGAIESGETARQAAARELFEETSITVAAESLIGPVWRRQHQFEWDDTLVDQHELYFLAHHDGVSEAALNGVDPVEVATMRRLRWWTLDDVASAHTERFVPESLAHHLRLLLRNGQPDHPHDIEA